MNDKTCLAHIDALEAELQKSINAMPESADALASRAAEAAKLREKFLVDPTADNLAAANVALGAASTAQYLMEGVINQSFWKNKIESAWTTANFSRLGELLERNIGERSARSEVFREVAAKEIGRLTEAIVLAGANSKDSDSERIELVESDLSGREATLFQAKETLAVFRASKGRDTGYPARALRLMV